MYRKYLKTRQNKFGITVYTEIDIPKNTPIIELKGKIYSKENLPKTKKIIQVGNNKYLGPSADIDDELNHSCSPNCKLKIIGNRVILYSTFKINQNSELTFDYSLYSTASINEWSMVCLCGSYNCRKTISGYNSLSSDIKNKYLELNAVPLFIQKSSLFIDE